MQASLVKYLFELGQLKRVRRSGWWLAGIRDAESVAEHSFRAAAIGYLLAEREGADAAKVLAIVLFHDAAEARLNDLHRLGKRYVDWDEAQDRAAAEQEARLPRRLQAKLTSLRSEAKALRTREAQLAHDADRLECLFQACEYAAIGYPVEEWIESSVAALLTSAARKLAAEARRTKPASWQEARNGPAKIRRGLGQARARRRR